MSLADSVLRLNAYSRGPLKREIRDWNPFDLPPDVRFVIDALRSIRAKRAEQDARYLRGERAAPSTLTDLELMYLRQGGTCCYCSDRMWLGLAHISDARGWKAATEDHVQPRSRGGNHTLENKMLACRYCNEDKSDLTASEYLEWRMSRATASLNMNGRAGSGG